MNKTIVGFVSVLALGPVATVHAEPPVTLPTTEARARPAIDIVPIYLSGRRALAVLRIGDHPPAPVVFDTGTSGNDMDSDYAAVTGLDYDPQVHVRVEDGTGNSFEAKQAIIPVASLGGVPLRQSTATVFPYKERDVVGIFGPTSFSGRQVLVDLGKGRLIVRDRSFEAAYGGVPYGKDDLPRINVQIAGKSYQALLDSGSDSDLLLPETLSRKLSLTGPLKVVGKARTVSGDRNVYEGKLKGSVKIGHIVLHNPTVRFSGKQANVGLPIIRQLQILLDPERRKSWIVEPKPLAPAKLLEFAGRFGIRTLRAEKGALVFQRDDRPAYKLTYLGNDLFRFEESGELLQFWRTKEQVNAMDLVSSDGDVIHADRTR